MITGVPDSFAQFDDLLGGLPKSRIRQFRQTILSDFFHALPPLVV